VKRPPSPSPPPRPRLEATHLVERCEYGTDGLETLGYGRAWCRDGSDPSRVKVSLALWLNRACLLVYNSTAPAWWNVVPER
jgi:hypothetical protein